MIELKFEIFLVNLLYNVYDVIVVYVFEFMYIMYNIMI